MLSGIDGVLLVVVIGEGKLVVPVDFAIRRPDPTGPGAPCRDKLHWVQSMLDGRMAAFRQRGVALPPPIVVADSWFSDSKLMRHVARTHEGTLLVEGKSTYVFTLPDGCQVKGEDLQHQGPNLAKADFLAKENQRRQKYPQDQCVMPTHTRTDPVGSKKVRTVHGQRSFECLEASISAKAR